MLWKKKGRGGSPEQALEIALPPKTASARPAFRRWRGRAPSQRRRADRASAACSSGISIPDLSYQHIADRQQTPACDNHSWKMKSAVRQTDCINTYGGRGALDGHRCQELLIPMALFLFIYFFFFKAVRLRGFEIAFNRKKKETNQLKLIHCER